MVLRGRESRSRFLVVSTGAGLIAVAAVFVIATCVASLAPDAPASVKRAALTLSLPQAPAIINLVGSVVVVLCAVWAWLATSVRRLHDLGVSGLVVLLFFVAEWLLPTWNSPDYLPNPVLVIWTPLLAVLPGKPATNTVEPVASAPGSPGGQPSETAIQ